MHVYSHLSNRVYYYLEITLPFKCMKAVFLSLGQLKMGGLPLPEFPSQLKSTHLQLAKVEKHRTKEKQKFSILQPLFTKLHF